MHAKITKMEKTKQKKNARAKRANLFFIVEYANLLPSWWGLLKLTYASSKFVFSNLDNLRGI